MYPCHTYCLPRKLAKTMGYYKGKADAFVLLLDVHAYTGGYNRSTRVVTGLYRYLPPLPWTRGVHSGEWCPVYR